MDRLQLPEHLHGVFFDARWETERVWALPTPTATVSFPSLAWHLALTVWSTVPGEARFDLSPRDVLSSPPTHPAHWARIHRAELAYPLEMFQQGARWVILDGYHRLCRHALLGHTEVAVRRHPAACWSWIAA